jgi:hypothetical protein
MQNHDQGEDGDQLQPGGRFPLRQTVDGSNSFGRQQFRAKATSYRATNQPSDTQFLRRTRTY